MIAIIGSQHNNAAAHGLRDMIRSLKSAGLAVPEMCLKESWSAVKHSVSMH